MARRTIVEIAERLGVSIATVSRALNDAPGVSEAMRLRVLATADELGYHPNAIARRLQGQRANTLCYAVDISNRVSADMSFFKDFITELAERCGIRGLDLLLHPTASETEAIGGLEELIGSGRADGLIISDARVDDWRIARLTELHLPFVMFGRSTNYPGHSWVDVDGAAGIRMATKHLIKQGHRRIGLLGLSGEYSCAVEREQGFFAACAEAAIHVPPEYIARDLRSTEATRAAMQAMLVLEQRPTAFVATSDMIALQAISAAARQGLRAGHDYAITGFDDLPIASYATPPLTTLRQPLTQVCDALITTLVGTVEGTVQQPEVLFQPELVVRESSVGVLAMGQ